MYRCKTNYGYFIHASKGTTCTYTSHCLSGCVAELLSTHLCQRSRAGGAARLRGTLETKVELPLTVCTRSDNAQQPEVHDYARRHQVHCGYRSIAGVDCWGIGPMNVRALARSTRYPTSIHNQPHSNYTNHAVRKIRRDPFVFEARLAESAKPGTRFERGDRTAACKPLEPWHVR
jgi:hypothetical protein